MGVGRPEWVPMSRAQLYNKMVRCSDKGKASLAEAGITCSRPLLILDGRPEEDYLEEFIIGAVHWKRVEEDSIGDACVVLCEPPSTLCLHGRICYVMDGVFTDFKQEYPFLCTSTASCIPYFPSKVAPHLYVGDIASLNDAMLRTLGINCVISFYPPPFPIPSDILHHEVLLEDCKSVAFPFDAIDRLLHESGNSIILFHCHKGRSRSCIAAAYTLVKTTHCGIDEALFAVRNARIESCPNAGFRKQLHHLELEQNKTYFAYSNWKRNLRHWLKHTSFKAIQWEPCLRDTECFVASLPLFKEGMIALFNDCHHGHLSIIVSSMIRELFL